MRILALAAIVGVVLSFVAAPSAIAEPHGNPTRQIGNFIIKTDRGQAGQHDTAIAASIQNGSALGVACLADGLHVFYVRQAISDDPAWKKGMRADVLFRIDGEPVIVVNAVTSSELRLELARTQAKRLSETLAGAQQASLSIQVPGSKIESTFALEQSWQAISVVFRACSIKPPNEPAPRQGQAPQATVSTPIFGDIQQSELNAASLAWTKCVTSEVGRRVGASLRDTGKKGDFETVFTAAANGCDQTVQLMEAVKDKAVKTQGGDAFFKLWSGLVWADIRRQLLINFKNTTLQCVRAHSCR